MDDLQQHPIDKLAEAFLERYRRGEHPSLDDVIAEHPDYEQEIRDLFPALLAMERLAPSGSGSVRKYAQPQPERLGDYQILREIGRGGMGIVYEAVHQPLKRHVALKVLPSFAAEDPTMLKRFSREATAAGKLHHPNIIPVFDVGQSGGLHYYSMQFVAGQSVAEVMSQLRILKGRGSPAVAGEPDSGSSASAAASDVASHLVSGELHAGEARSPSGVSLGGSSETRSSTGESASSRTELSGSRHGGVRYWYNVARIGVQLAGALQFAHAHGVVHRDVKPSNILLDAVGTAWITDFGLAHVGDHDLTQSGTLLGTLRYMAPEQLRGWADPRTDVYGLGLTLYELLTLRPAFTADERAELIKRIADDDPPKPRQIDRSIPPDLETIVLKAIEKEPGRRYQTAGELADDLSRFLDFKPIRARQTSTIGHVSRWCRRNPQMAGLTATTLLLLILLAVGGWTAAVWLAQQAAELRQHSAELAAEKQHTLAELFVATLNEAHAARNNRGPGRRVNTLSAVERAAGLLTQVPHAPGQVFALRNLTAAALTFSDAILETTISEDSFVLDLNSDLTLIACGGVEPGKVVVRRVRDDQQLACLSGPDKPVAYLQFSPGSQHLAVAYADAAGGEQDSVVWVWDWERAEVLIETTGYRYGIGFAPDSSTIAIPQLRETVEVYDLKTADQRYVLRTASDLPYPQFRPGHGTLAVSSRTTALVSCFDSNTGEPKGEFTLPQPPDGGRWSLTGRFFAYSAGRDVALWDAVEHRHAGTLVGHRNLAWPVGFSAADRAVLTYGWDGRAVLWEVASRQPLATLPGRAIRWSTEGHRFAVEIKGKHTSIYRAVLPDEFRQLGCSAGSRHVAVAPDGKWLAVGGDGGVCLIAADTLSLLQEQPVGRCESLAFHPSGANLVATSPRGLLCWDLGASADGSSNFLGEPRVLAATNVATLFQRLTLDADGDRLAYTAGDRQVRVMAWQDPTRQFNFDLPPDVPRIENIALSGDGRWLAAISVGPSSHVVVWDTESTKPVHHVQRTSGYGALAFNPSGRHLIVRLGKEYVILETGSWRALHRIDRAPTTCWAMAFSPDGRAAALSLTSQVFQLYDTSTYEPLLTLEAPNVLDHTSCRFSPDGTKFYATATTGHLCRWDLAAIRRQLREFELDWE